MNSNRSIDIHLQHGERSAGPPDRDWRRLECVPEILALGKTHQDKDSEPQNSEDDVDEDTKGISEVGTETSPGRPSVRSDTAETLYEVDYAQDVG